MGKVVTPKYRIELTCINFIAKRRETHKTVYRGKVSDAAAKKYRDEMNKSLRSGGTNEHLRKGKSDYSNAYIVNQKTGETVAQYIAPKFETV